MNRNEILKLIEKIESTRNEILDLFTKNNIEANEALSLMTGMLIQFYCELVENESKESFLSTLEQCYDAYQLLHDDDDDDDEETVH